jgi:hypothetical protein
VNAPTLFRYVLRVDGTREVIEGPHPIQWLLQKMGADTCDTVNLRNALGQVMLVDDNGWETELVQEGAFFTLKPIRARKPINVEATKLYHSVCRPGTTHQIVGDVVVVPDSDFAGPDDMPFGSGPL